MPIAGKNQISLHATTTTVSHAVCATLFYVVTIMSQAKTMNIVEAGLKTRYLGSQKSLSWMFMLTPLCQITQAVCGQPKKRHAKRLTLSINGLY